MTTAAPHSTQNRFSRIGFSLGLRSHPELRGRARDAKMGYNEEDWYIPYTGPYELPPETRASRNRDRDSWGDPVFGLANAGPSQGSGLHTRYDVDSDDQHGFRSSGESRAQGRVRSHSMVSNYTESTGVDHTRSSLGAARRSNVSSSQRAPALSYSSLDTAGGVGESPIPPLHGTASTPHRTSLASLFGTLGIKSPSNSVFGERGIRSPPRRLVRPSTASGLERSGKSSSTNDHHRTASGDSYNHSLRGRRGITEPLPSLDSQATTDDDYYNSYYSTLIQTPARAQPNPGDPPSVSTTPPTTHPGSSPTQHPYARALPKTHDLPPQPLTAPPTTNLQQRPLAVAPKLTFSKSQTAPVQPLPVAGGSTSVAQHLSNGVHQRQIKGSTSTPNLADRISTTPRSGTPRSFSKGRDWWFSAETWCDALLFPRPRLKLKGEGSSRGSSRGRIVSPPGSPVLWSGLGTKDQSGGVASRVLVHSRSLVDLREGGKVQAPGQHQSEVGISLTPPKIEARSQLAVVGEGGGRGAVTESLKPPRPKSWALDDLALLSRIPSLTTVLADSEKLADERKMWQSKAFNSLGNKQARSVSRARSKSLTANGRKSSDQKQGNINFLAARAHLGNQDIIPVLPSSNKHRKTSSRPETNSRQSHSRHTSHSRNTSQSQTQNSSLIQTLPRSSKSHSRSHSRNESWGKTAFKAAKSTAAACLNSDATVSPVEEKKPQQRLGGLEDALQGTDTKVIRLADPALIPIDRNPSVSTRNGVSPTPSGASSHINDSRIGIALSTPPIDDFLDRENIRLATHPYAQGGLYSYTGAAPIQEKATDYAGPHPSATPAVVVREAEAFPESSVARHKLPPHVALHHPYAQAQTNRDSYEKLVKHPRVDSNIPPPAKMWVPLAPGVVREILPADLRYSPFIDGDGKMAVAMASGMDGITDTVGVGEALAYAAEHRDRESKDSGLGTSENIHGSKDGDGRDEDEYDVMARLDSPSRVPVQYDVTKPTYLLQRAQRSVETAHTFASSPLEYLTPKIPDFVRSHPAFTPALPRASSDSSSQTSPRPLGSPTDLVGFQDLFYKPGSSSSPAIYGKDFSGDSSSNGSQTRLSGIPYDLKAPHRRPASGLTSLARKLSEEYEQLSILERTSSRFSASSGGGSVKQPPSLVRRPTEGSLEFVFEEVPHPDSPTQGTFLSGSEGGIVLPFRPQANIPEDVVSVSENEKHEGDEDEDETEVFHLKRVETSTPAAVPNARRLSFTGQMAYTPDRHEGNAPHSVAGTANIATETEMEVEARSKSEPMSPLSPSGTEARVLSGLQAPPTELTRSSYITTSTDMSRMSNLSDFPTPPKDYTTNDRVSLLSAYFDEALGQSSGEPIPELPSQMLMPMREESPAPSSSLHLSSNNRLTFGAGADVEEIVQVLSD